MTNRNFRENQDSVPNVGTLFVSSEGIGPVTLVFEMMKTSKFVQRPSSVGRVPLILVYCIDNSFNAVNAPIPVGIVPVIS